MYLQKTVLVESGNLDTLELKINELILNGSRIDFVLPNHHGTWLVIYTPNKIL